MMILLNDERRATSITYKYLADYFFRKKDKEGLMLLGRLVAAAFDTLSSEWQPISEYIGDSISLLELGGETTHRDDWYEAYLEDKGRYDAVSKEISEKLKKIS